MCQGIQQRVNESSESLTTLEKWFEDAAYDVLEQMPDQESARKLLLTSEPEFHDLGSRRRRSRRH